MSDKNISIIKSFDNHVLVKYDCEQCFYSTLSIVDSMNTFIDTWKNTERVIQFLIICPLCNNVRVVNAYEIKCENIL